MAVSHIRRALITGLTGFVGQELARQLTDHGYEVIGLGRHPMPGSDHQFHVHDLSVSPPDASWFEGVDVVFHLAGRAHALSEKPGEDELYRLINIEGTRGLVAVAEQAGVRAFVFMSSVKAMGEGGGGCMSEQMSPNPQTPYGRSKLEAEHIVLKSAIPHTVVIRPPLVFGPNVKGNLERMLRAIDARRFPPLPDTANRRSMIHVADLARACIEVSEHSEARGQVFVVNGVRDYSTHEIASAMASALGRSLPKWTIPMVALKLLAKLGDFAGHVVSRRMPFDSAALERLTGSACVDATYIGERIGFHSKVTLESALPAMVSSLER